MSKTILMSIIQDWVNDSRAWPLEQVYLNLKAMINQCVKTIQTEHHIFIQN